MTRNLKDFINELQGFSKTAEETLKKIEENMVGNRNLFSVFSERMFTIRGTAQQLELPRIAQIAGLGEEIAIKGTTAERRHVRKCVGCLWDALTTVKFLLENHDRENTEEEAILVNRLQKTLESFGGARATLSEDEINKMLG